MSWYWFILISVIQIITLFAPFKDISKEFLITADKLPETKEYASAANCITILLSFPVFMFITIIAAADMTYPAKGVSPIMLVIYVSVAILIFFSIFCIPVNKFRGKYTPYYWILGVIIAEVLIKLFFINTLVKGLKP